MKQTKKRLTILSIPFACLLMASGTGNVLAEGDPDIDPALAPLPMPIPAPPDNPITDAKVELGKLLFFDPKLTGDASLSCGDCHDPKQGWGFNDPISRGYPGAVHWRNTHTAVNTAYLGKLFWQGNVGSLEKQAPTANKGAVAGNGENDVMEARLRQTPYYIEKFKEIMGTDQPMLGDAWMLVATFERGALTQIDSPLDRYLNGDKSALSETAVEGMELFTGKANCIECHNGPLLSDEKYYNLGTPRPIEFEEMGINTVTFRWENYAKGVYEKYYREWKDDAGLGELRQGCLREVLSRVERRRRPVLHQQAPQGCRQVPYPAVTIPGLHGSLHARRAVLHPRRSHRFLQRRWWRQRVYR